MANYKHTDSGIEFKSVPQLGLNASAGPLGRRNSYVISGDTITNILAKILNAVDINWNGAEVDENTTINTTGLLLSWIKNIETTPGETGADGKSAYDIAKENGYNGSVSQWLASLKGEIGATGPQGIQGVQGILGEKGEKGDAGKGFSIYKTYESISAMNDDRANVPDGEFVIISNEVENEDNAKLYIKNSQGQFTFIVDMSGATGLTGPQGSQGPQGPQGIQGIQGELGPLGNPGQKGDDGKSAYLLYYESTSDNPKKSQEEWLASLKGADGIMTFDDLTPEQKASLKGDTGDKGDKGDKGDTGEAAGFGTPTASVNADVGTPSVTITSSGTNTAKVFNFEFKNLKGEKGDKGDTGAAGEAGNKGDKGDKGDTGADGRGISSITEYYLVSSSNSGITRNSSGWNTAVPTITSTNKYLWNYKDILYTNNTHSYSNAVVIGVYGDKGDSGSDGTTPHIDLTTKHWMIGNTDTGVVAEGGGNDIDISKFEIRESVATDLILNPLRALYYDNNFIGYTLIKAVVRRDGLPTNGGAINLDEYKYLTNYDYRINQDTNYKFSDNIIESTVGNLVTFTSNNPEITVEIQSQSSLEGQYMGLVIIPFNVQSSMGRPLVNYTFNCPSVSSRFIVKLIRVPSIISSYEPGHSYYIILRRIPNFINSTESGKVMTIFLEEIIELESLNLTNSGNDDL